MPSPRKTSAKRTRPMSETTGASPLGDNPEKGTTSVAQTLAAANATSAAAPSAKPSHQTDGQYIPTITGPITSVRQLTRGPNVAKNSIGSFQTMAAYSDYLRTLRPTDLKRHALEEARVVPIDDTARLIRRLEANWTAVAQREGAGTRAQGVPARTPFTAEQLAAQEQIRRQMLGGRA